MLIKYWKTQAIIQQSPSLTAATYYTLSFFAKAGERTHISGIIYRGTAPFEGADWTINLVNGTILNTNSTGATNLSSTIASFPNGWYRVALTFMPPVTGGHSIQLNSHNGTSTSFTSNNSIGFYAWGVQLETGSVATSYIPTLASQVTRAADICSFTDVLAMARWIGAKSFSFYLDSIILSNVWNEYLLTIRSATDIASIATGQVQFNAPNLYPSYSLAIGQRSKFAIRYESGSTIIYLNGVQQGSVSTNGVNMDTTAIYIGTDYQQANRSVFLIKSLSIFQKGKINSELQILTQ
jgi:hypothetical protein